MRPTRGRGSSPIPPRPRCRPVAPGDRLPARHHRRQSDAWKLAWATPGEGHVTDRLRLLPKLDAARLLDAITGRGLCRRGPDRPERLGPPQRPSRSATPCVPRPGPHAPPPHRGLALAGHEPRPRCPSRRSVPPNRTDLPRRSCSPPRSAVAKRAPQRRRSRAPSAARTSRAMGQAARTVNHVCAGTLATTLFAL